MLQNQNIPQNRIKSDHKRVNLSKKPKTGKTKKKSTKHLYLWTKHFEKCKQTSFASKKQMIFNPTPDKLILGKTKSRRPFFERKHKKSRSNVGLSMDSLKNNIKMNVNVNPKLQNIYMNLKPKKRTTHTKPSPLLKKTSNLKKSDSSLWMEKSLICFRGK